MRFYPSQTEKKEYNAHFQLFRQRQLKDWLLEKIGLCAKGINLFSNF